MPTSIKTCDDIQPGDFYEDCALHPCLCIKVDHHIMAPGVNVTNLEGISLINGSYPRSCSLKHCAPRKLTFAEVLAYKFLGEEVIDWDFSEGIPIDWKPDDYSKKYYKTLSA